MKINRTDLLAFLFIAAPAIYGLIVYPELPDPMPIHFGPNGQPDGFAKKSLFYIFLLPALNAGSYLFIRLVTQLDPKTAHKQGGISLHLDKILFFTALLLSIISFLMIYSMQQGEISFWTERITPVVVALFISALGNYMNNIRPNYFVGFRTPWTLENEDVWRKTHQLGAKIWFWGGIITAVIVAFCPIVIGIALVVAFVALSAIFITYYSYSVYQKTSAAK